MHMKLCDIQMARQTGTIIFPRRFLPKDRWDEAAMAQAKKEIEKHLEIVEPQLTGKEYLVGNRYSLVEVCYTPFVEFLGLDGDHAAASGGRLGPAHARPPERAADEAGSMSVPRQAAVPCSESLATG